MFKYDKNLTYERKIYLENPDGMILELQRNLNVKGVNPFFRSCNTDLSVGVVNPLKCMLQYVFCLGGVVPGTQL